MKVIALVNVAAYDISFAGIGFQDGADDYLLVVFKGKKVFYKDWYKSLKLAKTGFLKKFKEGAIIKRKRPQWTPFAYSYSFLKKTKILFEEKNGEKKV